ncbi:hypothetical protein [Corynebacterium variabile]|uniref:hypothetical protein n=1 Tax=Corynebacterium variabile TaxID=1727 RepID=UPI0026471FBA|nr:hypothetical protein [Corynebacterium variabile]MDN6239660.1 Abi family protein [Corynebacterium variabile]MDN6476345.1 Abi family protein [Corynebacterium variabile]MDN6675732.1 Abi family protein [Corynebacterium variabile]MDN6843529.1 Abi family protein [Corynebacterium variabile]
MTSASLKFVSEQRMKHFFTGAFYDELQAIALYDRDRRLAAAFFQDISILEIALRNAIDRALSDRSGAMWFASSRMNRDARTTRQLCDTWARFPAGFRQPTEHSGTIRGRLISTCMFGLWVSILDSGGGTGLPEPRDLARHDEIRDRGLLLAAFPGGQLVATAEHGAAGKLTGSWVHEQVRKTHLLRNRVAHHEPLILD